MWRSKKPGTMLKTRTIPTGPKTSDRKNDKKKNLLDRNEKICFIFVEILTKNAAITKISHEKNDSLFT